jgi:hypothetical protein
MRTVQHPAPADSPPRDRLPDFLIIGAMKSATTSLYFHLGKHPDVAMSRIKEPDFFRRSDEEMARNLGWYQGLFSRSGRVKGEASTSYTKHPAISGVPRRIQSLLPRARLIYLVRDPIERLISHYHHQLLDRYDSRPIDEVIFDPRKQHLINCSRYFFQLQQYLPYFPREQILVVVSERLGTEPLAVMREVFEFIGVDPEFRSPDFGVKYNDSGIRRRRPSATLTRLFQKRLLGRIDFKARTVLPARLYNLTALVTGRTVPRPSIDGVLTDRLRREFRKDVEDLKAFTGLTFSEWKHDYAVGTGVPRARPGSPVSAAD